MEQHDRDAALRSLADYVINARLDTPTDMLLDATEPIHFLLGQGVLFMTPFLPRGRWRMYAQLLADEDGWSDLQTLLHQLRQDKS